MLLIAAKTERTINILSLSQRNRELKVTVNMVFIAFTKTSYMISLINSKRKVTVMTRKDSSQDLTYFSSSQLTMRLNSFFNMASILISSLLITRRIPREMKSTSSILLSKSKRKRMKRMKSRVTPQKWLKKRSRRLRQIKQLKKPKKSLFSRWSPSSSSRIDSM